MTRKLYVAPIVHPISPDFKEAFDIPSKGEDMANQTFSEIIDTIHKKLSGKNIDKIFFESSYRKVPVKEIAYEPLESLCRDFGIDEIEKTESSSSYFSDVRAAEYMSFGGIFGKRIHNIFVRKRDYEMAKHVSKGLKEGEVGLLIFGGGHEPEGYLNLLASDIKLEHLTKKEDMFEKVEQIIEKINHN